MRSDSSASITDRAARAYAAGLDRGFEEHAATIAALERSARPIDHAWMHALGAQAWLAAAESARLPSIADLERFVAEDPEVRAIAGLAAGALARVAVLAFDRPALEAIVAVHESYETARATEGDLWCLVSRGWLGVVRGESSDLDELASEIAAGARALGARDLAIEAAVLRVFVPGGSNEDAIGLSRRASRMAQSESLAQQQYLANLVLARERRLRGASHLATRILTSLLRVAPPPWRPWLRWELLVADGACETEPGAERSSRAVAALDSLLRAAERGDRPEFDAALGEVDRATEDFAPASADARAIAALIDPEETRERSHDAWAAGAGREIPRGAGGIAASWRGVTGREGAYVLVRPGAPPRRFLALALGLERGARELSSGKRTHFRTDAVIAMLALAPDGLDETALFEAVYGFGYQAARHSGVRRVLFHRVRARLEGLATIDKDGSRMRLVALAPLWLPDPRCSPPAEHAVLAVLARSGRLSIKDAAAALGLPIRTVQDAFTRLANEGACRAERRGAAVDYHLEDTTFNEPTRA
jgi:hypothetical protein